MPEDISYQGPRRDYEASDGSNRPRKQFEGDANTDSTFADIDYLRKLLRVLQIESEALISELEAELNGLSMKVRAGEHHDKLREAVSQEWPSKAGPVGDSIPYYYYKALEAKGSASAAMIRRHWASQARDIAGPKSFDFVQPAYIIKNEADLAVNFINTYISKVNDASEKRIVELLQEWAASAIANIRQLRGYFEEEEEGQGLTQKELDTTTKEEALKYQALFKVKVNDLNSTIEQELTGIRKSYSSFSDAFYNRVLGPALIFRLKSSSGTEIPGSKIGQVARGIAAESDSNLNQLIVDMMRRNVIFIEKMNKLNDTMNARNTYRMLSRQLAPLAVVPQPSLGAVAPNTNPADWYDTVPETATPSNYRPSHNKLEDRDDPGAHPNLLDRFGRNEIVGDLDVAEGAKIDGVDLDTHEHTGRDGSRKIQGMNIVDLVASSIDTKEKPGQPFALKVLSSQLSRSKKAFDVEISWFGDPDLIYDVQIIPVSGLSSGDVWETVYDGSGLTAKVITSLQTHDGETFTVQTIDLGPNSNGFEVERVGPDTSPTTLFGRDDLVTLYGALPSGTIDDPLSLLIGDFEVTQNGDMFFPAMFIRGQTSGRVVKYSGDSDKLGYSFVIPERDLPEDINIRAITLDMRREEVYLYQWSEASWWTMTPKKTFFRKGSIASGQSSLMADTTRHVRGIILGSDFGNDGYAYTLSFDRLPGGSQRPVLVVERVHPITGYLDRVVLSGVGDDVQGFIDNYEYGIGFLVMNNEFLLSYSELGSYSLRGTFLSVSKSGTESKNVTGQTRLSVAVGLAKDRDGRVYTAKAYSNEIVRIFGPNGSGVF